MSAMSPPDASLSFQVGYGNGGDMSERSHWNAAVFDLSAEAYFGRIWSAGIGVRPHTLSYSDNRTAGSGMLASASFGFFLHGDEISHGGGLGVGLASFPDGKDRAGNPKSKTSGPTLEGHYTIVYNVSRRGVGIATTAGAWLSSGVFRYEFFLQTGLRFSFGGDE